jgi:hypothetical protein
MFLTLYCMRRSSRPEVTLLPPRLCAQCVFFTAWSHFASSSAVCTVCVLHSLKSLCFLLCCVHSVFFTAWSHFASSSAVCTVCVLHGLKSLCFLLCCVHSVCSSRPEVTLLPPLLCEQCVFFICFQLFVLSPYCFFSLLVCNSAVVSYFLIS